MDFKFAALAGSLMASSALILPDAAAQARPRTDISAPVEAPLALEIIVGEDTDKSVDGEFSKLTKGDAAFNRANIRMTFDGLDVVPLLNIGLTDDRQSVAVGETVSFQAYSNYHFWIDRAEIYIFDANHSTIGLPLTIVDFDVQETPEWTVPHGSEGPYRYRLRVYDVDGNYDETVEKSLSIIARRPEDPAEKLTISSVYGEDATALRNIPVRGGSVTVSGYDIADGGASDVYAFGRSVRVDRDGDFADQQILPAGSHRVDISYSRSDGRRVAVSRQIDIPKNDWFFIGLGDLTVGSRADTSRALVEASGEDFDETFVTGRAAFYLKGKIKGKYLLTAALDTTESDISDIFSNLNDRDPESLLRRLDPDRFYPVYGDDSTVVEDAPTQGRFYVRLERGDDQIVWGNFVNNIVATEFAQLDRGLYGAKAEYNSDATTSHGEQRAQITVFAADPGTLPAREEFLGTGGSVLFLENQDLTIGSERIRVEVRDQESGLVLSTVDLKPFIDYDIDYIQGRVLLSRPLSATSFDGQIVRDGPLSGNSVFLVARYEFTSGVEDIGGFTTGGRAQTWLGDSLRIGFTGQQEETADADQTLLAGDILVRKTEQTYFKAELSRTEGQSFDERSSFDGGFTFDPLVAGGDGSAIAYRLEGAASLSDFVETGRTRISGFYENLEQGFSGVGRLTPVDTERYGFNFNHEFGARGSLGIKFDEVDIEDRLAETTAAVDLRFGLTERWSAGLGARYNELTGSSFAGDGERTDIAAELRYDINESFGIYGFGQATVASSGARQDANRGGVGLKAQLTDALRVRGEVSGGDGGAGALTEITWQVADGEEYYLNYTLDAERTEPGLDGSNILTNSQNAVTVGARRRFSSFVSVFGEERASFGNRAGLTHAYGIDITPVERWTVGATFEIGDLEEAGSLIEREAYTVSAGYTGEQINGGGAFEWREDAVNGVARQSWLFRSNLSVQVSEDWRALAKFNRAESDSEEGGFFSGDFTEAQLAGAYRPVENDRFNALFRYTFFEDLAPAGQFSSSQQNALPAQRSHIISVDGQYRLTPRLTIGGKYGYRSSEVSISREEDGFFSNATHLVILRGDIHIVEKWDAVVEARYLSVDLAEDSRTGVLVAVYRHLGDHAKLGIGYNFTDFSDNLTDLSFNDNGVFLNLIAKF